MARDIQVALLVRTGCPRVLDYKQRRQPFFAIKEFLVRHLFVEERSAEYLKLSALRYIGAQGYPGLGVSVEFSEVLGRQASVAVKTFGRAYLPWMEWPTPEEEKKLQEAELVADAQDLIEAWIQRFEPENAGAQGNR